MGNIGEKLVDAISSSGASNLNMATAVYNEDNKVVIPDQTSWAAAFEHINATKIAQNAGKAIISPPTTAGLMVDTFKNTSTLNSAKASPDEKREASMGYIKDVATPYETGSKVAGEAIVSGVNYVKDSINETKDRLVFIAEIVLIGGGIYLMHTAYNDVKNNLS